MASRIGPPPTQVFFWIGLVLLGFFVPSGGSTGASSASESSSGKASDVRSSFVIKTRADAEPRGKHDTVAICAPILLKYEEHTLYHWVTYHLMMGFEKIFLYIDDRYAKELQLTEAEWNFLKPLEMQPRVEIRRFSDVPGKGPHNDGNAQLNVLADCYKRAGEQGIQWTAHFDGDEYMTFGRPIISSTDSTHDFVDAAITFDIGVWLEQKVIADGIKGILVPRVDMFNVVDTDTEILHGHMHPPVERYGDYFFEGELYTGATPKGVCKDLKLPCHKGKTLARTKIPGLVQGVHVVELHDAFTTLDPLKSNYMFVSGAVNSRVKDFPTAGKVNARTFDGLRLYHYQTRSVKECRIKRDDAIAGVTVHDAINKTFKDRRAHQKDGFCKPYPQETVDHDFSVAQFSKSVRTETSRWIAGAAAAIKELPPRRKLLSLPLQDEHASTSLSVYLYDAPDGQADEDLLGCFADKFRGQSPEIDSHFFTEPFYLPQDMAELYLIRQIRNTRRRTRNPREASLFFVDTMPVLSMVVGTCKGLTHEQRQERWATLLESTPWLQKYPEKHLTICQSWTCRPALAYGLARSVKRNKISTWYNTTMVTSALSKDMQKLTFRMRYLIHEDYSLWSGRADGDRVIVVPYVAHSDITPQAYVESEKQSVPTIFFGGCLDRAKPKVSKNKTKKIVQFQITTPFRDPLKTIEGVVILNNDLKVPTTDFDKYITKMKQATFCLVPAGDTASSRRLFDAVLSGCIPVFIGPKYVRPFEAFIPYDTFSVALNANKWMDGNGGAQAEINYLLTIDRREIAEMRQNLQRYAPFLDWRHGTEVLDMIVNQAVAAIEEEARAKLLTKSNLSYNQRDQNLQASNVCLPIRKMWEEIDVTTVSDAPLVIGAGEGTTGTHSLSFWVSEITNKTIAHFDFVTHPGDPRGENAGKWRKNGTKWLKPEYTALDLAYQRIRKDLTEVASQTKNRDAFDYKLFDDFGGIFDVPIPQLFPYIFRTYPNAMVVLSTRDADSWVTSRSKNHKHATAPLASFFLDHFIMNTTLDASMYVHHAKERPNGLGRSTTKLLFEMYNLMVRCLVPPSQLIEIDVFKMTSTEVKQKLKSFFNEKATTSTTMARSSSEVESQPPGPFEPHFMIVATSACAGSKWVSKLLKRLVHAHTAKKHNLPMMLGPTDCVKEVGNWDCDMEWLKKSHCGKDGLVSASVCPGKTVQCTVADRVNDVWGALSGQTRCENDAGEQKMAESSPHYVMPVVLFHNHLNSWGTGWRNTAKKRKEKEESASLISKEMWKNLNPQNTRVVGIVRRNTLDQLMCTINDCLVSKSYGKVVFENGTQVRNSWKNSSSCVTTTKWSQRGSSASARLKIKLDLTSPDIVTRLQTFASQKDWWTKGENNLNAKGFSVATVAYEDLAMYEHSTEKRGPEWGTSIDSWVELLQSLGVAATPSIIQQVLEQTITSGTSFEVGNTPHSEDLFNPAEVKAALVGTEFERFWRKVE
jgi:hypothetical protein